MRVYEKKNMFSSMKKTVQVMFVLSVFIATGGFCLQKAEAKSVSWSKTESSGTFLYKWNGGDDGNTNNGFSGWAVGLKSPSITVSYTADVYNNTTGAKLNDGASVPIGTVLRFTPKAYESSDISWFGTGYSSDSPNGHWAASATAPPVEEDCLTQDQVTNFPDWNGIAVGQYYVPLNINPPAVSYSQSGTATLSCNANKSICTVNSAGTIVANIAFAATNGKLYYRYSYNPTYGYAVGPAVCVGNQTPMNYVSSNYAGTWYCGGYEPPGGSCTSSNSGSQYTLSVPAQTISFNLTAAGATNTAPNPPTITGPTTGAPNTAYSFAFRGSDPNSDTVRYGIDWDNNSSVDAWLPASGYVASNTSQSSARSWTTTGVKTFKAQTQDSKGATSGWSSPFAITLSNPVNTPTLNYAINGSTSSVSVPLNANLNIVWSSTNITSCTAYGAGWSSGSSVGISGNINIPATQTDDYILNCVGSNGSIARSITVNLVNTLKVCQNSCSSGIQRGNTSSTQSFTLAQGGTQNLVSCFNPSSSCNDASGNVTSSTTWGEQGGNNTAALSGTDPKTVTGTNGGSENISASYSSQTNNMTVNVACLPTVSCDNAPGRENYCQSDTFTVDNGCGVTLNCNGTKSCNYNWKEVAP